MSPVTSSAIKTVLSNIQRKSPAAIQPILTNEKFLLAATVDLCHVIDSTAVSHSPVPEDRWIYLARNYSHCIHRKQEQCWVMLLHNHGISNKKWHKTATASLCYPPKRAATKHAKATQSNVMWWDEPDPPRPHTHTYSIHLISCWLGEKPKCLSHHPATTSAPTKKIIPKVPMIKNTFLPCRTSSGSLSGSGWWLSRLWRWTCGRRDWKDNTHFIRGALSSTVEVGSSLTISGFEQRQWRDPQTKLYHAQWILEQFTLVLGQNTFYSWEEYSAAAN